MISIENAILFMRAVNDKLELRERLAATDDGREWIEIARDAGFECTLEDFAFVLTETLGRSVCVDDVVVAYREAVGTMGARDFTRVMYRTFIGGVQRSTDAWTAGVPQQPKPRPPGESVE